MNKDKISILSDKIDNLIEKMQSLKLENDRLKEVIEGSTGDQRGFNQELNNLEEQINFLRHQLAEKEEHIHNIEKEHRNLINKFKKTSQAVEKVIEKLDSF